MSTLFETQAPRPLADRLRPRRLADIVGQDHLLGPAGPIGRMVASRQLASIILWGRGVSYHGAALSVDPDLDQFRGIAPEVSGYGVTSLARLGITAPMAEIDIALRAAFAGVFGAPAIRAA
jgi:hypothetical protein